MTWCAPAVSSSYPGFHRASSPPPDGDDDAAAGDTGARRLRPDQGVDHHLPRRPGVRGIIAAAKPRNDKDAGPQLDPNLPFSQKVAVSKYDRDGYVGSQAVFSDLTFAELPELAQMNSDAQGVNLSLRRAGDLVILEGRADLTSLTDPDADVELTVAFPGAVTSTNGDRVDPDTVQWKLKPGVVSIADRPGPLHRSEHPLVPAARRCGWACRLSWSRPWWGCWPGTAATARLGSPSRATRRQTDRVSSGSARRRPVVQHFGERFERRRRNAIRGLEMDAQRIAQVDDAVDHPLV